ncbi:MAG: tRNA preQ1(34) S-adenosylmethionine ribosyltransferase-isomerase QueA [Deltaproteobacteria bacterium]|nr:tRNA preQ1(34) S-adenosylmethionine ribosyltransferase-isomerase QueA [Deltaproteobacteria bacterium]
MLLSDFDYELPSESIAQQPTDQRDQSRLMAIPRLTGEIEHRRFSQLTDYLSAGDLLVLNDTRVIPARLRGHKESGGKIEILLDRPAGQVWQEDGYFYQRFYCLVHSSRPLKPGKKALLAGGGQAILETATKTNKQVLLKLPIPTQDYLEKNGEVPLPAYIKRRQDDPQPQDRDRYQTVYAKDPGAIAAPTAGLHFTTQMLKQLERKGIELAYLTLHVGPGTFLPVRTQNVAEHVMHSERYAISRQAARAVEQARKENRRVVAVGTTVVRTLEAAWKDSRIVAGRAETDLFIRPGYEFKVVDALLTNFHLPKSTLLMLVCAFSTQARVISAYKVAVANNYRFFSYGDATFLF